MRSTAELKHRFKLFLNPKAIARILPVPVLLAAVQMAYYDYLTGTPFLYAYEKEGFDFLHPNLLQVWFSPHNGLFVFAPMMVFAFIGLGRMAVKKLPAPGWESDCF